ncbi:MAG: ABC transporter ATP-binding protein/permease [Oscillospiraceae bacterium]|nr:ABC transporter ATP-binding protein/permease [Oscillospiraceae bacterium]
MKIKVKEAKGSLRLLLPYILPYKWLFLLAALMIVLQNICFALMPMTEGQITTQLARDVAALARGDVGAAIHYDVVLHFIIVLIVIYAVKTITGVISVVTVTNATQDSMQNLRGALQKKVHTLPVQYFDVHPYGDILSRITNDVDTVSNSLQQTLLDLISDALSVIFAAIMMFRINVVMALIALIIIPYALLITRIVVKHSQKQFRAQQDAVGELNGRVTELYTGYNEILLYNKQKKAIQDFREVNGRLQKHAFRAQFLSSIMSPLICLGTYLIIGTTAALGCTYVLAGTLLVGSMQAFIRYIWQMSDPISQITQMSGQIQSAFAAMGRVTDFLSQPDELAEANPPAELANVCGEVTFRHVRFDYGEGEVIHDLSFDVKPGQMVAIVGPTGAGKTTLINLLLRFYDVGSGEILVDGKDIRTFRRDDLRSAFGMVLQDTWLFSGTIAENLRYGRLDASRDEIVAAAKEANVHHFIRTLPEGYDMKINEEGSNISQGEKQLLTIARALLRDPPILILDEATSSVDTRLEKLLQDAMKKIMLGRTCFVIAHRLSTIRNADLILVLRDGDIVEQGTHTSLMQQNGFYAQLYNAQFASIQK